MLLVVPAMFLLIAIEVGYVVEIVLNGGCDIAVEVVVAVGRCNLVVHVPPMSDTLIETRTLRIKVCGDDCCNHWPRRRARQHEDFLALSLAQVAAPNIARRRVRLRGLWPR